MIKVSDKHIGVFAVLVYFISQYISDILPAGQLLILFPLAMLGFLIIKRNGLRVRKQLSPYLVYMYGFALFCAASMLWAADPSLTVSKRNSVFIAAIAMTIIYLYSYYHLELQDLLTIIMYGGYISVFIISLRYGWSGIRSLLSEQERMTSNVINSNTLGMCTAYTLVINFYFILYGKRRLIDFLVIPAIVIVAITGSRKALMIMVGGVFALLLLKNLDKKNTLKVLVRVLIISISFFVAIILLNKLSIFSNIMGRMDDIFEYLEGNATRATNTAWLRFAYTKLGWEVFLRNPILGIGIGNASIYTLIYYGNAHYLHNNYMELLACGGFVGFFLHYWLFFYLLWAYIRNFRQRDKEFNICFVLLIFKLIMDIGDVSYYTKPTYFYLLLFVMGAKRLKEDSNNRQKNFTAVNPILETNEA